MKFELLSTLLHELVNEHKYLPSFVFSAQIYPNNRMKLYTLLAT